MANIFYPINTPLRNYFFYKNPQDIIAPVAGGKLFFYADEDHNLELPTYSDVSDPNNPVINTNPIVLGEAGDCPLFYLDDRLYYIVFTDASGDQQDPIWTVEHYNPAENTSSGGNAGASENIIANGQFSYPIRFWKETDETGLITQNDTGIAWGWQFEQDANTTTKNLVTFNDISNEEVEGNPIYEVVLTSTSIQAGESLKQFVALVGNVEFEQGNTITISAQLQNKLAGNTNIYVKLIRFYGVDGSPTETIDVTTFVATEDRAKFSISFSLPAIEGKSIGIGNHLSLVISGQVGQICSFGMTNILFNYGTVANPVYTQAPASREIADILGSSTVVEPAGLDQNWSSYFYHNGNLNLFSDTGTFVICPTDSVQPFRLKCDGSSYNINAYTANQIPYKRLYDVIGNTFGGSGDLIVHAENNKVVFQSDVGAREKSPYTAGTTSFTVTQNSIGLYLGISAEVTAANQLTITWVGNFAPDQVASGTNITPRPTNNLIGYWNGTSTAPMVISVVDPGSGSNPAEALVTFSTDIITSYRTRGGPYTAPAPQPSTAFFWEFAREDNNTRGNYPTFSTALFFAVDGSWQNPSGVSGSRNLVVPYLSSAYPLLKNIQLIAKTINNPFIWTFTISSVPSASEYFLYSSADTDYYGWFTVDGMGTDPMVVGRTGVEIEINSSDSTSVVAQKIAAATNNLVFSVPDSTDLPTVPSADLDWFINL